MLDLNINKSRTLNFSIQLGGINPNQLTGCLTFMIDSIQFSIPAKISESEITVSIPPLSTVLRRSFAEGEEIQGKLEVHGNNYYLNPWSGSFIVKNPVTMEATVSGDIETETPEINVDSISDDTTKEEVEIVKDKSRDEEAKKKAKLKLEMINRLVDETLLSYKSNKKQTIPKKVTENKITKINKNNKITEEYIVEYIEMYGSKNKQIQELILDQSKVAASENGRANDLEFVFKKVQKILPRGKKR